MTATVLYWLFVFAIIVQLGYGLYFFIQVFSIPGKSLVSANSIRPVSIIICAKNEADNLQKNLPAVLSQKYHDKTGKPLYEVIVVNDGSTDSTMSVLKALEQQFDNLWDVVIDLGEERQLKGKKHALQAGVAHASHNWLVLIDADCTPASDQWLKQMVAPLADGKEIVAGFGGYTRENGLLNAYIRWETLHTFIQYSSYALKGLPYMAVGRNMACTKAILQQAQSSPIWNKLPSGDDDLLVAIAGTARNTAIVSHPSSFTWSAAKQSWKTWREQKKRHLSTGKYYKGNIKLLLAAYAASHAMVWIAFFILLCSSLWQYAVALVSARCLFYWITWAGGARRVMQKDLIYFFPLFDIGWMVYNFAFLPYITWKNKQHWT